MFILFTILNLNNMVHNSLPIWTESIWPVLVYLKQRITNQSGRLLLAKHVAFCSSVFSSSKKTNETLSFGDSTLGSKQRLGRNACTCFPGKQ